MTTLAPPPSSETSPVQGPARMVRVSANLLPDSVIAARRLSKLQRQLALGLVALIGLIALAYGWSWWQTKSARDDLSAAQHHNAAMRDQMRTFAPLLAAQAQQEAITSNLRSVMSTDIQWRDLFNSINAKAGHGVQITGFNGSVLTAAGVGSTGLNVLNNTGLTSAGTLTISGTATDNKAVAAFVDGLAVTKGLASPIPTSVAGDKGNISFSISLLLTSDALGGRFTPRLPTTGGN